MPKLLIHIMLIAAVIIFCIAVNFTHHFGTAVKGLPPSNEQLTASLVSVILWLIYGLVMGFFKQARVLALASVFWGLGILLLAAWITFPPDVLLSLFIVVYLIYGLPVYGLSGLWDHPTQDIRFTLLLVIPYGMFLVGYALGRGLRALLTGRRRKAIG